MLSPHYCGQPPSMFWARSAASCGSIYRLRLFTIKPSLNPRLKFFEHTLAPPKCPISNITVTTLKNQAQFIKDTTTRVIIMAVKVVTIQLNLSPSLKWCTFRNLKKRMTIWGVVYLVHA